MTFKKYPINLSISVAPNPFRTGEYEVCILLQLYEKVTLTSSHILQICFPGKTISSVHKVLVKMKRLGLVVASSYCLGQRGKLESVYMLTRIGWQSLVELNVLERTSCPYRIKKPPSRIADYVHQMAIVQYWIDLEMDMRNQLHFEIGLFVPEYKRLDNGKTITLKHEIEPGVIWQVRNDALFTIVNVLDGREYLFLLEIDRGTMPIQADSSRIADCIGRPSNRSSVERKLHKIQKLLSVSHEVFPSLGSSFRHFRGARVIIVTSSSQRVCNIIKTIKLHPELLQQQVFLFSIVDETRKGAFNCRYAVPTGEANQLNTLRGLHICL